MKKYFNPSPWILPERDFAQQMGWTHQVQWIEDGKACLVRYKRGELADRFADKLVGEGLKPTVIDLTDALRLH